MDIPPERYPQVTAGVLAIVVFPLVLGIRHANALMFIPYAALAGFLFTAGEWLMDPGWQTFDWVQFAVDCWIRAVAVFLIGGFVFILALLLL